MKFIESGTTKRYSGNSTCAYDDFIPKEDDICQFGCEFEFYINSSFDYQEAIESITKELYLLTSSDILVDMVSVPNESDKDRCMQIKPDISLQDNGVEISVPISTKEGIVHFIEKILPLIDKYGYTNEETGFHIHISTLQSDSKHIDFYRFMLLCDDAGLLSSWSPRVGYSQNVMDILKTYTKKEARVIKTKKGTIWNLEKIDTHHIEIKSIGGMDYHKSPKKIVDEFYKYETLFIESIGKLSDKHKQLFITHNQQLEKVSKEVKKEFASALSESGMLDTKK